jgi:hypothetical protein
MDRGSQQMIQFFFHLKHSDAIAEQKKLPLENFCRGPLS